MKTITCRLHQLDNKIPEIKNLKDKGYVFRVASQCPSPYWREFRVSRDQAPAMIEVGIAAHKVWIKLGEGFTGNYYLDRSDLDG